jgi:hypothetical protein
VNGAVLWLLLIGGDADVVGGAASVVGTRRASPIYPECPPPFERRTSAREDIIMGSGQGGYVADACGGFDANGRLTDGWEVSHYEDGRWREEHRARGRLNGPFRAGDPEGGWWIANYVDDELEGRREYWHKNGGKWQETEMHRGRLEGPGRSWYPNGSVESIWIAEHGRIVADLRWAEDGTLASRTGDVAQLAKGKTLEQLQKDNARAVYPRPSESPSSIGPLGSRTNPIRCAGPYGEREYLHRLRCADGTLVAFRREGSVGIGPRGHVIDDYRVSCGTASRSMFFDMYHPHHRETAPVDGFNLSESAR